MRNYQTILQRVEPFYIHTISVALHLKGNFFMKPWWHFSKAYLSQCLGWERFLWEPFGGRKKTANRGEWIGTLQTAFTRKPAQGDHVGSRRHSYQSRLCSQLMTFAPHARPSVRDPSNLGNLLFLLKLRFIEILFGVSLLVTSSLSCLGAKMWSLFSRASFLNLCCWLPLQLWYQNWLACSHSWAAFPWLLQGREQVVVHLLAFSP